MIEPDDLEVASRLPEPEREHALRRLADRALGRFVSDALSVASRDPHQSGRQEVDDTAWDGPAAMSKALKADSPATAFKAICAGQRDGDTSLEATWALPHHKNPGDPPNAGGVGAAQGYFDKTQGLINKQAAQAHLDAHSAAIKAYREEQDKG